MTKTCTVKNRLRALPPITRPPSSNVTSHGPKPGTLPGHRAADRQAPVGVRVPAKNLPGEEHPQREQQQADAHDPGQLARILVGPVQEDLGHVRQDHDDHARPGVVVQCPQEPAQRLLVVQVKQTLIGLIGGRHVDQRQADSGDDLQHASSVIEALPKTYHHPFGPATAFGMGWLSMGPKTLRRFRRASSHSPSRRGHFFMPRPAVASTPLK